MENYKTSYYLGANTPKGFYSLYNEYISCPNDFFYFIKAGPGCGKSSFMKRVGRILEKKNIKAEYIYCSADKASLDGIYFPTLNTGIVDATAPHILEPAVAGVSGSYLSLGEFYDIPRLKTVGEKIRLLNFEYKEEYKKAYNEMFSAAQLSPNSVFRSHHELISKIEKRANSISAREFKGINHNGSIIKHRFLNGFSADGHTFLSETIPSIAEKIYLVDNSFGLSPIFMNTIFKSAKTLDTELIVCLSPETPEEILHIIVPDLSLAFISQTADNPYPYEYTRHLRLDAMVSKDILSTERYNIKNYTKVRNLLLDTALTHFKTAKKLHDEMEQLYNPFVDFDGIYAYADKFADSLIK